MKTRLTVPDTLARKMRNVIFVGFIIFSGKYAWVVVLLLVVTTKHKIFGRSYFPADPSS